MRDIGDTSSEPRHPLRDMVDMTSELGRLSNGVGNMSSEPGHPLRDIVDMSSDASDTTWLKPRLNLDACYSISMESQMDQRKDEWTDGRTDGRSDRHNRSVFYT